MSRRVIAIALIVASAGCSSTNRNIAIRSINSEAVTAAAAQDALARGDLLFSRGEHALALDAYRRAMRKDPADAHALNGVAISYAAIGRHDLAREFFELALARAPQDERIYRNFARSLMAQGRRDEAETLLAQMSGAPRMANRPTLAQLAVGGTGMAKPVRQGAAALDRVSMGEMRLRTAAVATPGRMNAQLSTAIVTVAQDGASVPVASLSRELRAPIVQLSTRPVIAPVKMAVARPKVAVASAGCGPTKGATLRATGFTISLSSAPAAGKCPGLAGGEEASPLRKGSDRSGTLG
jgi:hypothetical protein